MAYTPPARTSVNFALTATTPPSRTNVNFEFNDSFLSINEIISSVHSCNVTSKCNCALNETSTSTNSDLASILKFSVINETGSLNSIQDASLAGFTVTYFGNGNTGGTVPVDSTVYSSGNTVTVLDNTGSLVKVA